MSSDIKMGHMNLELSKPSVILSLVAFLVAFSSSLFAVCDTRIRKRRKGRAHGEDDTKFSYEDEDGAATEQTSSRWPVILTKSALTCAAWLGLFLALSRSFYEHQALPGQRIHSLSTWLSFASWVSASCSIETVTD